MDDLTCADKLALRIGWLLMLASGAVMVYLVLKVIDWFFFGLGVA